MNRIRQLGLLLAAVAVVTGACASLMLVHASAARSHAGIPKHGKLLTGSSRARTDSNRVQSEIGQTQLDQGGIPVMDPFPPNCTFQPLTLPPAAPAGAATAVLAQIPSGLSQSAGVEYTPCSRPVPAHAFTGPVGANVIGFHIVSVTRYVGTSGTVYITLDTPTPAAVAKGLYFGTPSGVLPDGSQLYVMNATGEPAGLPSAFIQWIQHGTIVTLSSGDVSASRLAALANKVSVR